MSAEAHPIEIIFTGLDSNSAFSKFDKTMAKYCNSENTSPVITCSEWQATKKLRLAKNVIFKTETAQDDHQPHRYHETMQQQSHVRHCPTSQNTLIQP
jgi:hypothetical protein